MAILYGYDNKLPNCQGLPSCEDSMSLFNNYVHTILSYMSELQNIIVSLIIIINASLNDYCVILYECYFITKL